MIKIIGFPAGNKDKGSSRLRYYNLLNNLPFNCSYETYNGSLEAEVIYIQKKVTTEIYKIIKTAKLKGIKIIYDIDDKIKYDLVKKVIKIANIITVDTITRQKEIKKLTKVPVEVIPPGIDYINTVPDMKNLFKVRKKIKIIGTYGNSYNMALAKEFMKKGFKASCNIIFINASEWQYSTFLKKIIYHDIEVLFHANTKNGNMKSPTRLINTMALGLPTIVSNTYSYAREMRLVGTPELIIVNNFSVKLSFSRRQRINTKFKEYAWDKYDPVLISNQFYNKVLI